MHDSKAAIKTLLAGAAAVQLVSTVYKNGPGRIQEILAGIESWMDTKSFTSIDDFKGRLRYSNIENPAAYERIQFMKQFAGIC